MSYYHIEPLRRRAYRITSAENVFMDLFVGSKYALLWDTGYGFGDLAAAVRSVTELPLIVVNSHGHPDHACGNFRFPGPIYIHPDDFSLCGLHNSPASRRSAVAGAKEFYNWALKQKVSLLPEGFDEEAYVSAASPALSPLSEGHIFDLGGLELEVVALPGHTAGSIGLLWREEKLFYIGDAMASFLFLFLPESLDLSAYKATLEKASSLPFDHMVPGHGFDPMPRSALEGFRRCALELDYDKGIPFPPMPGLESDSDARVCPLDGKGMDFFGAPDFFSIVISPKHMS